MTSPAAHSSVRRNLRREGSDGEDLAARYLVEHGYRIVERNFRFRRRGEIDIIAREGEDLVFCEVKLRSNEKFGAPEYAVTRAKQERIRRIAAAYLALRQIDDQACRFDVVMIRRGSAPPVVTLMKNAF